MLETEHARQTGTAASDHGMRRRLSLQRLNLVQVFTLLSFLCISVGAVILGLVMSHACRTGFERLERSLTGSYVRQQFHEHFSDELFSDPRAPKDPKTMRALQDALSFADVFRIKLYGPSGEILWSDEQRLVQRVFQGNELLRRALSGEVVSKIEASERPEHVYERDSAPVVQEVYVPLYSKQTGLLLGVIEVYRTPRVYLAATRRAVLQSWLVAVGGGICLYCVLLVVVRRAYRKEKRLESELKTFSRELLRETEKLNSIVDAVGAGLCVLDKERRIVWVNNVLERWFGGEKKVLGRLCQEIFSAGCGFPEADDVREFASVECNAVVQSGERRWFQITPTPIRDADGQVVNLLVLIVNITERKAMEFRLVQAGKMAALGELAGSVVHEINNPIGVISLQVTNLLGILGPDLDEARIRPALREIQEHAARVGRTASGLLSFSRQSMGERRPVDLNAVVREAVHLVEHRLTQARTDLRLELSDQPCVIEGDSNALQQVVVNILTNAADAMPGGGRVTLATQVSRGGARESVSRQAAVLTIEDNGAGMPQGVLEHIFDFFFTTKDKGRGTGLGLPISRRIITEHGGEVQVWSEENKGTRFEIVLPLATTWSRVPMAEGTAS